MTCRLSGAKTRCQVLSVPSKDWQSCESSTRGQGAIGGYPIQLVVDAAWDCQSFERPSRDVAWRKPLQGTQTTSPASTPQRGAQRTGSARVAGDLTGFRCPRLCDGRPVHENTPRREEYHRKPVTLFSPQLAYMSCMVITTSPGRSLPERFATAMRWKPDRFSSESVG